MQRKEEKITALEKSLAISRDKVNFNFILMKLYIAIIIINYCLTLKRRIPKVAANAFIILRTTKCSI